MPSAPLYKDGILTDGYHRWQAHDREKAETILAVNLGDLSDAEILRESIVRNAGHGQQLARGDKQRLAGKLWGAFAHMSKAERVAEIAGMLSVSESSAYGWSKDARKAEKEEQKATAWDMWLDCETQAGIAEAVGMPQQTVSDWLTEKRKAADFGSPPGKTDKSPWGNVQHFDVWTFASAAKDEGAQSYFGALPPQVIENLLWFYTEPGSIVVDLFGGSGTTIDVAKRMGRRGDEGGGRRATETPTSAQRLA